MLTDFVRYSDLIYYSIFQKIRNTNCIQTEYKRNTNGIQTECKRNTNAIQMEYKLNTNGINGIQTVYVVQLIELLYTAAIFYK